MAPSRGPSRPKATKIVAPTKRRKATPSSRRHHFTSFSSRIATLKIAPLRSSRTVRPDLAPVSDDLSSAASSYFATALREWTDLNLSAHFTEFADEVLPQAESLPMVLHREEAIVARLLGAIEETGVQAAQPLFALLGHLAHDLDYRFEAWFERAFEVVATKVGSMDEVEGLEWGFNCLGWLVKYMSRVLLGEGELAGSWWRGIGKWLGREKQRPFVVRFMGEVVGFLLRRAAKEEERLLRVVGWLLEGFGEEEHRLWEEGLKVAFSEAVKGAKLAVHPDGVLVLEKLYSFVEEASDAKEQALLRVTKGTLISIIHYTDSNGFEAVQNSLLEFAKGGLEKARHLRLSAEILYIAITTRKGSRISDWRAVADAAASFVHAAEKLDDNTTHATEHVVLRFLALTTSIAPVATLMARNAVYANMIRGIWTRHSLPFCYLVAELAPDRFKVLLLPIFQKFVAANWQQMEVDLVAIIPRLHEMTAVATSDIVCPPSWQQSILEAFETSHSTDAVPRDDDLFAGYLRLLQIVKVHDDTCKQQLAQTLWKRIEKHSADAQGSDEPFLYGDAMHFAASIIPPSAEQVQWLAEGDTGQRSSLAYWEAIAEGLSQLTQAQSTIPDQIADRLYQQVVPCLRAPSHEMRLAGLKVMQNLYTLRSKTIPEMLETIVSIEDTAPSVQMARYISSQIRRLGLGYEACLADPELSKAVPTYLFGLLHLRLSQAWEDAAQVLKEIARFEQAEAVITDISSKWLEGGFDSDMAETLSWSPNEAAPNRSDFECSNVNQVEALVANASSACEETRSKLAQIFKSSTQSHTLDHSFNRTQALLVLRTNPQLAEKRSRLLVPVLLRWTHHDADQEGVFTELAQRWNRKDQKAMLDVFAQFQNPRVLFKTAEVYQALLRLLSNGDAEIQTSALKTILAWKQEQVIRYQEHLLNFLDDARFREEISVFLRLDEEEGIRPEDIDVLSPVLLRLLYGLLVNRTGNASGIRGKQTKRKAVFGALTRFPSTILAQFIDVALEPLDVGSGGVVDFTTATKIHPRKQIGVLNTINDMFDTLGAELEPYSKRLAGVALSCLLSTKHGVDTDEEVADEDTYNSLSKAIRRSGYSCLVQAYTYAPGADWQDVNTTIIKELLLPRLDKFVPEVAQSISGMLKLLSVWSKSASLAEELTRQASGVLTSFVECLESPHCPDPVKIFLLDEVVINLLVHSTGDGNDVQMNGDDAQCQVLHGHMERQASRFLHMLSGLVQKSPSRQILDSSLACTLRLVYLVTDEKDINDFIVIGSSLLQGTNKQVPVPTKRQLLLTVDRLLKGQTSVRDDVFTAAFRSISSLFTLFRDRESRQDLCNVLSSLCRGRSELEVSAALCQDLNSFAVGKIDEPDFDRRDRAFSKINDDLFVDLNPDQWRPLIFNMLFYIRDNDELSIRTSASFSLQRFVEAVEKSLAHDTDTEAFRQLVSKVLVPGMHSGMHQSSELVRTEYLAVLSQMIRRLESFADLTNLAPLLAGNDEEASFFLNILHVQQHRRLRALRRVASEASKGQLSSSNVANILLPLLEHFVMDAAQDESAHNLTAETIHTISALTACLNWSQYKSVLRKYIGMMKDMEGKEKTILRLVGAVIDGLYQACSASAATNGDAADGEEAVKQIGPLQRTLPPIDALTTSICEQLLPPLTNYLHLKDESTVSLRVPVGVVVVKLLKCLPDDIMVTKLPGVLLDLCHILRSRDQSARDMTRKTLSEITALLGSSYFHFIVKELKSSLQRGYQLHVLSFTVHSILLENLGKLNPGDLDHCISDIALIIMDDIFGIAGQEKDAEEYISRMKEVKSSKSYDSMELVAKITSLSHLSLLIRPIQNLLSEKLDLRTVKKIDELLRRLAVGVTANPAVTDRSVLVFCYEIIQQTTSAPAASKPTRGFSNDYKTRRYLIQMHSAQKSATKASTSSYTFKLTRFAIDLLRTILSRHDDLRTPQNIAGFVPMVSEALVSGAEEVQLASLRLLTSIMRVPHPELARNASTYVSEAVKMLKAASSMTTEAAQAALKLLTAALRDKEARIREQDLAWVLKRVGPDLEEPDRQGVIFGFLKAVVGRKIVIAEVYEVMDLVGTMMVTNQTKAARELSRGLWVAFCVEYPQTKGRWEKQLGFLVRNLDYIHPEGRRSVLEALHGLVRKTGGDMGQELCGQVFVPLVLRLVNDEDREAREMAGILIKEVFENADGEREKAFVSLLRSWVDGKQLLLKRVALQVWKVVAEIGKAGAKDLDFLLAVVGDLLPTKDKTVAQDEWELVYYGLQLFGEIAKADPSVAFATKTKQIWTAVYRCLIFPHAWVKLSAARLIGVLFGDIGKTNKDVGLGSLPLPTSGAVVLSTAELRLLCGTSIRVLRYEGSSEQLLAQTCRNLVFLGRCYGANGCMWDYVQDTTDVNGFAEDAASSEAEDEVDDTADADGDGAVVKKTGLVYLVGALSSILRRNQSATTPTSLPPKLAALQTLHALLSQMQPKLYSDVVETVIHPLILLTDSSIPKPVSTNPAFTEPFASLTSSAQETMTMLQNKLGSSQYVKEVTAAQKNLREKREGRRVKRRIEAVAQPERAEKRKARKVEGKTRRKKERGEEYKGRRRGW